MDGAVLGDEHGALSRHGDEHVARSELLHLLGVRDDLLARLERNAVDLAQLVVVGLDEQRLVREDLHEQVARGIDHDVDAAALHAGHDALIHIVGKRRGDGAGDDEDIAGLELVELGVEGFDVLGLDVGADAVDLGLLLGLGLEVDAGHALRDLDEVAGDAELLEHALERDAGEARGEAKGAVGMAEVSEDDRDVHALAAGQDLLVVHAVDLAELQVLEADDVVERGVERYGVDHVAPPVGRTVMADGQSVSRSR